MLGGLGFTAAAVLADILVIAGFAVLTGSAYHLHAYQTAGAIEKYAMVGGIAALCYTLPFLFRDEYRIHDYLDGRRTAMRTFLIWNYAFLCLSVIGFLTKTTGMFSRGWLLAFYLSGFVALTGLIALMRFVLRSLADAGRLACRRIMLVGPEDEINRMSGVIASHSGGIRVVAAQVLPRTADLTPDSLDALALMKPALDSAVSNARALHVDDIILLSGWSRDDIIHEVVNAFTVLPVSIHLGASSLLGRFSDARVSRFGAVTAVSLTAPPLGPLQEFAKRSFDVFVAALALLLLSPLFAVIALLIRFDSSGPVFFLQRRRGYNLKEFRIWKFRTMSTLDDGETIIQAQKNDVRVTRIGSILRRFNLDELPQLINVVRGEMSLVGPRPHAVAHDKIFEQRILSYPRRLNVRPGITGWAQVNGFRGRTETDDAMRERVKYDLYYIDNWSIVFDLYILVLTVLSPKAFRNAH